jgi:hypothetical protein
MPFTLDQIVPWGRSFDEYVRMFSLTSRDLDKRILGCGDGPASFNAAMRRRGRPVVSVDPLYAFSTAEIRQRIRDVYPVIMEQLVANEQSYVWHTITTPEECGRLRREAMEEFLADFEEGRAEGRYLAMELPELPFADGQFGLALCSHLLFTYSQQLSAEFHGQAIVEMCRVAGEVRVFPLLDVGGRPSPHLEPVRRCLSAKGYRSAVEPVDYEFQRGSNQMLRVWRPVSDGPVSDCVESNEETIQ